MKKQPHFLLVEDNPNDVFLVKHAFSRNGNEQSLHVVTDGQEAMDYLMGVGHYSDRGKYPLPGVILLDIKMPRVTGLEFLKWFQRHAPAELRLIPIIVMSSSDNESDIKKAYELGANCYLVKPIPWPEFEEQMKTLGIFWGKHVKPPPVKA